MLFRSAESQVVHPVGAEATQEAVSTEQRLQDLESTLSAIQKNLAVLVGGKSKELESAKPRTPQLLKSTPKPQACGIFSRSSFPWFRWSHCSCCIASRCACRSSDGMSKLLKGKPQKLGEGGLKRPATAAGALSDTEPELIPDGEEHAVVPEDGGGEGSGRVETAIVKLTELCASLANKKKESVETLLDGTGLAGSSETSSGPSNRRNAAALRALQKTLQGEPPFHLRIGRKQSHERFHCKTCQPRRANASERHYSKLALQSKPCHELHEPGQMDMGSVWDMGLLDSWKSGTSSRQMRPACGGLRSIKHRRGSWVLGNIALLEPPPPYHLFSVHQQPGPMEMQHSALFDSRWTEVFLAHVKEMDSYQEAKRKLGKPGNPPKEDTPAPKIRPKAKGKGKKDGSNPDGGGAEN